MTVALRDPQHRRAGWYRMLQPYTAERHYAFPTAPTLNQAFAADDDSQWSFNGHAWELMSYAPERWLIRKQERSWFILRDEDGARLAHCRSWAHAHACARVAELAEVKW